MDIIFKFVVLVGFVVVIFLLIQDLRIGLRREKLLWRLIEKI